MRAALIVIAIAMASGRSAASPSTELDLGVQSFRAKNWQSAIRFVNPLLYPHEQLVSRAELVDAHIVLGVSDYEIGKLEDAKSEFEKALQLEPGKVLDPLLISQGAVRLFNETRAEIETRQKRDADLKKAQETQAKIDAYLKSLVVYESHPYYLNFVPFGTGQFQNKQKLKGILFATGQGLTLTASTSAWLYLVNKYGITSNHVQSQDVGRVNLLVGIEEATGVAFLALYAWSSIDAVLHYKAQTRVSSDPTLLPPELRAPESKPKSKKTSLLDGVHLTPMLAPNSVGIGLAWEN